MHQSRADRLEARSRDGAEAARGQRRYGEAPRDRA